MHTATTTRGLTFCAELHEYRLDGQPIPSVTQLLRPLVDFSFVPEATLEAARERGSALHQCIEYDQAGELDEATIDPIVRPYFDAWRAFRVEAAELEVWGFEVPIASRLYRYGCTPDVWGRFDGAPAVIEIKTTAAEHPTHALQTAGQAQALIEAGEIILPTWRAIKRYSLRLTGLGQYRLTQHTDEGDLGVLLALRQVAAFRARHNL